ncbi:MAG: MFS transporter [Pseudomonadota bacterium]
MSLRRDLSLSRAPALAFASMGVLWGSFAAFVPDLKEGIGASDALFGMILSVAAIGLMSAMLVAPALDRRLAERAMPVGALFLAVGFLFPGLAGVPLTFALAMLWVAFASGLLDIVMNARVSELEAAERRSLMNLNHAMFSFAYAGAAFVTGLVRAAELPPVVMFLGLLALIALLTRGMRMPVAQAEADNPKGLGYPLRAVILGGIVVMIAFMTEAASESWSALHVERSLGGNALQGALGPTMLGLTMGVGRLTGQVISERMDNALLIGLAAIVSSCGAFLAAAATSPLQAYLGFGILGLGVSVIAPTALAMVGQSVGPGPRTHAISRTAVIGFSGFFLGPPMMGLMSEFAGLSVAFMVVGGLLILSLVPIALLKGLRREARG